MTLHVDAVALEEHLAEPSPARLRRQLSSIGVVPSKPSLQRRASYLSTAMGIGTVDPDMHLHPVLVIGMLYFKNPLSLSTLRTVLLERLLQLPRFGSIVVDRGDGADFVPIDKASLDMKYHVSDVPQPQGAWSTSDVDAFLSKLNEPAHAMDTSKPLWRFFQVGQHYSANDVSSSWAKYPLAGGVTTQFIDMPVTPPSEVTRWADVTRLARRTKDLVEPLRRDAWRGVARGD